MGINNDLGRMKTLERVFDLTRWGVGVVGKQRGYPEGPDDLNEKGRWGVTVTAEFLLEGTRVWTDDDGSKSLNLTLKVATPGHSAMYDTCNVSFRPVAAELEKPDGFIQERRKGEFADLLKLFKLLEIIPADRDWNTYAEAIDDLAAAWDQLYGRTVKAAVTLSVYKNQAGEMKGPYAGIKYWAKSDLDKKPEVANTDLPF